MGFGKCSEMFEPQLNLSKLYVATKLSCNLNCQYYSTNYVSHFPTGSMIYNKDAISCKKCSAYACLMTANHKTITIGKMKWLWVSLYKLQYESMKAYRICFQIEGKLAFILQINKKHICPNSIVIQLMCLAQVVDNFLVYICCSFIHCYSLYMQWVMFCIQLAF